ncbi:alpha/beta fold hydrolase [Mycobacteroides franklinii]|uniref:Putative aminoacrylate hydrolase RutD n=1 Tax=Mycobacteroides franklinii TaxID=948102 RepID=A0A4R8R9B1_9MYCO|nr:alpha/beta hydrolase [Mycobacteroides franklinii]TDZ44285.1 putative aminoacrylate hydrolase RutD [Mycobacteroides franklinii]TDZ51418.1 putative aminoacrylate hydrolase RutD [Mycobacteroides franklinii]TDZ57839.1 putative aminoacrylate hydrolase RutD [Mycobacteroides franklinii]TDZ64780.1 putative aminoacrylate hydrolase RutD [Mycobacteroides franklinii]TDZ71178.1 putative aminoacrylate hydrolase RutD [Mycobacteroides franklinii]
MTRWLLLRGLSREKRHWEQFPQIFAESLGIPVECLDAPGFGTEFNRISPTSISAITDDIRSRLDRRDEKWSLLAISLGGMIGLDWCSRYPEDFERAVIINSSTASTPVWQRFLPSSIPNLLLGRFRADAPRERAILAQSANNPDLDLDVLSRRWAGYLQTQRPSSASIARQIWAAITFPMPTHIDTPLLVLTSTHDRIVSSAASRTIADTHGAPIATHPSAGHDIPLDDGAWIAEQVKQWIG